MSNEQDEELKKLKEEQDRQRRADATNHVAAIDAQIGAINSNIASIDSKIQKADNARHSVNFDKIKLSNSISEYSRNKSKINGKSENIKATNLYEGDTANKMRLKSATATQKLSSIKKAGDKTNNRISTQISKIDSYISSLQSQRASLASQIGNLQNDRAYWDNRRSY